MHKTRRRELRARLLRALVRAGTLVPAPAVRGVLSAASPLARFTRYERLTAGNLELALGGETTPEQRRRIARGVRHHSARIFSEWLKLARGGDGAWIDRAVELDPSVAVLRRELDCGRGALVVTAHLGNWELLCARLRRLGLEGAVIGYERAGDPSSAWLAQMRRAYGVETLPQATSAREVLRVLQGGRVVGLLADLEDRRIDGEFLPFFGVPALTMTAPAALARSARIPLLPLRCVVVPGGRYRISAEEPLFLAPSLPRREATAELAGRLNRVFERWIREAPEQWAWHQARWRTRPAAATLIHS
ncbi:MAG: lysophospholipid acyltransferase family protein [Planctomycetota bacterium]